MFSSKRGQAELSLQQIIGLVLAILIVLGTLALFMGLISIFTNPPSSGSMATLNRIYDAIEALQDKTQRNTSCYYTNFFIEENRGLAGFNADGVKSAYETTLASAITCKVEDDCIEEMYSIGKSYNLEKPKSCGTNPCLCLCPVGFNTGRSTRTGDFWGDDCTETGAVCKQFPLDLGFDTFYRYGSYCEDIDKCDLVYDAENGIGTARGVASGILILKDKNKWDGDPAITIQILHKNGMKRVIQDPGIPSCSDMIRDMQAKKKLPQKKKKPEKKTDVRDDIAATKAERESGEPSFQRK